MAIGKNKQVVKSSRKGSSKKVVDAFARKLQYIVKAPYYFNQQNIGNTIATKTHGLHKSEDSLKGRVFEINLSDLQQDEGQSRRKVRLVCEEVDGRNVLTEFNGFRVTRDYICSQIRKRHSIIEAHLDISTLDGFVLRMFCIAFTGSSYGKKSINCYAKSSQKAAIRDRMTRIIKREVGRCTLADLVKKLIPEGISKRIEKSCNCIYPLQSVSIYKVKVIRKPRSDSSRILEMYAQSTGHVAPVAGEANNTNILTAELSSTA